MNSKNDPIHKRLAEFIESEIAGGTFVGISDEKEVFLSFDSSGTEDEPAAKAKIKEHFGDEITTIATIVAVSMEEVTQMVDGLNGVLTELEEEEKKAEPKPQILDIGNF
jgi:hypothetical protein